MTTSHKLIFINRYFYPDHSATSQILSDLAFDLAKNPDNQSIHIVTSRQHYDNASARLAAFETIQNVTIHRVPTTFFGRQTLSGRMFDYISFYCSAAIKLFQISQPGDILIAKTDPPLISIVALLIAKLKHAYLVNWLQDLFPEVAGQLGVNLAQGLPYKLLKLLRNQTLLHANMNIVIGELMAQRLRQEGIPNDQITIIPNWADGAQLRPIPHEHNPLRSAWHLQDKFVIGYSGNFGRSHDFTTLLRTAEAMKDRKDIAFLLIGGGAQLASIQKFCLENDLKNVIFKPYQARAQLSESLSVADAHLISLKPELEGLIVPSKFYGILAVGRPVIFIGAEDGELAKIITAEKLGHQVTQGSHEQLRATIEVLSKHNNLSRLQQKARAFLETHFDRKTKTMNFQNILRQIQTRHN